MDIFQKKTWNPGFLKFSKLFFPIMPYGLVFSKLRDWPSIYTLNALKPKHVQSFLSHNICFVEQKGSRPQKCFQDLYEPRIFLQGEVNTRLKNWHDFFNANIWFTFPKIKSVLNMRQFIAFDENASFPWKTPLKKRIREQDFLTMFDEGGCILVTLAKQNNIKIPFLFGHGFYERIFYGDSDLSACTLNINLNIEFSLPNFIQDPLSPQSKEILHLIDTTVSKTLSDRNYYKKEGAFFAMPLKDMFAATKHEKAENHT